MWEGGITSELFERLVSQGDISGSAGTEMLTNERAAGSYDSAVPQLPMQNRGSAGQEGSIGVYLAWVNPAMRQTAERSTRPAVSLMVVQ